MVEAARADIERTVKRPWSVRLLRTFAFRYLLAKPAALKAAGTALYLYEAAGLRRLIESSGVLKLFGKLGEVEPLAPSAQAPFFFRNYGRTFPAEGERRYRVALLAGCIANVCFARLNEATVRVLQKNGCDVVIPGNQNCCGALHVHAGWKDEARRLARNNIDACLEGGYDAILTNAAGCGSTLKEYHELLEDDPAYQEKARQFVARMKDVTEFLASVDLNPAMGRVNATATYQDSCHLAHGQRIRIPPRQLLARVPGLNFQEMPLSDVCCGSAGIYNVVQNEMSMQILEKKMSNVNLTSANLIVTANPGCMLQLEAGVKRHGRNQRVAHVVEVLDEAYRNYGH
jgi:glycolate oxidase iron-sulfur subunit